MYLIIQSLLDAKELPREQTELNVSLNGRAINEPGIFMDTVSASWNADGESTLKSFSLEMGRGSLVCLLGPVGAGKVILDFNPIVVSYLFNIYGYIIHNL